MLNALSLRMARLRARYREPHRAYHTQTHIDAMLTGLQELGSAVSQVDMVELAIWYHDAIYDPAATDNEACSAALLMSELAGLAEPMILGQAEALVRWTADHQLPPHIPADLRQDASLFLDLDMAVLGADPPTFDAYESGIAAEYVPVHGRLRFVAGRIQFLQNLLKQPSLFHTDTFHRRYDQSARDNIQRALTSLLQAE